MIIIEMMGALTGGEENNCQYRMFLAGTKIGMYWQVSQYRWDEIFYSDDNAVPINNGYYHVAVVRDCVANTVTFYSNGVQKGVRSYNEIYEATGGSNGILTMGYHFDGHIDEVEVSFCAVKQSTIQWQYNCWKDTIVYHTIDDRGGAKSDAALAIQPDWTGRIIPVTSGDGTTALRFLDAGDGMSYWTSPALDITGRITLATYCFSYGSSWPYEDFRYYTEVDPLNHWSITIPFPPYYDEPFRRCTGLGVTRGENSYLYKDMGSGAFENYCMWFITSITSMEATSRLGIWALTNTAGSMANVDSNAVILAWVCDVAGQ
jgi:hypothetical protein